MELLLIAFAAIFVIAFVVIVVMLRVPSEERAVERRLASLHPSAGLTSAAQQKEPLFREKPATAVGLKAWFHQLRPIQHLELLSYQSTGERSVAGTLLATGLFVIAGAGAVLLGTGLPLMAGLAGPLLGILPLARLYKKRQKRVRAFELALPDSIDMCSRALRAGHSLVAAIGLVAEDASEPARTEFAEIFRKQNYGLPMREALLQTLERVPSADFRIFATGILVQKDTGGNLTEVFDRIVHVIRERIRIQGDIRVHTSQGRLTGWILTLLPVILLILINLINPGYSRPLLDNPTGKKMMYAGIALLLMGGFVIRRIVNGIEV